MREIGQLRTRARDLPRVVAEVSSEQLPQNLVQVYLTLKTTSSLCNLIKVVSCTGETRIAANLHVLSVSGLQLSENHSHCESYLSPVN